MTRHIGDDPALCCLPGAWDRVTIYDIMGHGEPLPPEVANTAAQHEVDPHELDRHVGGEHGFEPHDKGFARAVVASVECMKNGGVCL